MAANDSVGIQFTSPVGDQYQIMMLDAAGKLQYITPGELPAETNVLPHMQRSEMLARKGVRLKYSNTLGKVATVEDDKGNKRDHYELNLGQLTVDEIARQAELMRQQLPDGSVLVSVPVYNDVSTKQLTAAQQKQLNERRAKQALFFAAAEDVTDERIDELNKGGFKKAIEDQSEENQRLAEALDQSASDHSGQPRKVVEVKTKGGKATAAASNFEVDVQAALTEISVDKKAVAACAQAVLDAMEDLGLDTAATSAHMAAAQHRANGIIPDVDGDLDAFLKFDQEEFRARVAAIDATVFAYEKKFEPHMDAYAQSNLVKLRDEWPEFDERFIHYAELMNEARQKVGLAKIDFNDDDLTGPDGAVRARVMRQAWRSLHEPEASTTAGYPNRPLGDKAPDPAAPADPAALAVRAAVVAALERQIRTNPAGDCFTALYSQGLQREVAVLNQDEAIKKVAYALVNEARLEARSSDRTRERPPLPEVDFSSSKHRQFKTEVDAFVGKLSVEKRSALLECYDPKTGKVNLKANPTVADLVAPLSRDAVWFDLKNVFTTLKAKNLPVPQGAGFVVAAAQQGYQALVNQARKLRGLKEIDFNSPLSQSEERLAKQIRDELNQHPMTAQAMQVAAYLSSCRDQTGKYVFNRELVQSVAKAMTPHSDGKHALDAVNNPSLQPSKPAPVQEAGSAYFQMQQRAEQKVGYQKQLDRVKRVTLIAACSDKWTDEQAAAYKKLQKYSGLKQDEKDAADATKIGQEEQAKADQLIAKMKAEYQAKVAAAAGAQTVKIKVPLLKPDASPNFVEVHIDSNIAEASQDRTFKAWVLANSRAYLNQAAHLQQPAQEFYPQPPAGQPALGQWYAQCDANFQAYVTRQTKHEIDQAKQKNKTEFDQASADAKEALVAPMRKADVDRWVKALESATELPVLVAGSKPGDEPVVLKKEWLDAGTADRSKLEKYWNDNYQEVNYRRLIDSRAAFSDEMEMPEDLLKDAITLVERNKQGMRAKVRFVLSKAVAVQGRNVVDACMSPEFDTDSLCKQGSNEADPDAIKQAWKQAMLNDSTKVLGRYETTARASALGWRPQGGQYQQGQRDIAQARAKTLAAQSTAAVAGANAGQLNVAPEIYAARYQLANFTKYPEAALSPSRKKKQDALEKQMLAQKVEIQLYPGMDLTIEARELMTFRQGQGGAGAEGQWQYDPNKFNQVWLREVNKRLPATHQILEQGDRHQIAAEQHVEALVEREIQRATAGSSGRPEFAAAERALLARKSKLIAKYKAEISRDTTITRRLIMRDKNRLPIELDSAAELHKDCLLAKFNAHFAAPPMDQLSVQQKFNLINKHLIKRPGLLDWHGGQHGRKDHPTITPANESILFAEIAKDAVALQKGLAAAKAQQIAQWKKNHTVLTVKSGLIGAAPRDNGNVVRKQADGVDPVTGNRVLSDAALEQHWETGQQLNRQLGRDVNPRAQWLAEFDRASNKALEDAVNVRAEARFDAALDNLHEKQRAYTDALRAQVQHGKDLANTDKKRFEACQKRLAEERLMKNLQAFYPKSEIVNGELLNATTRKPILDKAKIAKVKILRQKLYEFNDQLRAELEQGLNGGQGLMDQLFNSICLLIVNGMIDTTADKKRKVENALHEDKSSIKKARELFAQCLRWDGEADKKQVVLDLEPLTKAGMEPHMLNLIAAEALSRGFTKDQIKGNVPDFERAQTIAEYARGAREMRARGIKPKTIRKKVTREKSVAQRRADDDARTAAAESARGVSTPDAGIPGRTSGGGAGQGAGAGVGQGGKQQRGKVAKGRTATTTGKANQMATAHEQRVQKRAKARSQRHGNSGRI
jgi:hypothetical protein